MANRTKTSGVDRPYRGMQGACLLRGSQRQFCFENNVSKGCKVLSGIRAAEIVQRDVMTFPFASCRTERRHCPCLFLSPQVAIAVFSRDRRIIKRRPLSGLLSRGAWEVLESVVGQI